MADDITPSSSGWATVSMKPSPDEEINALWARNLADNTGYLFNRAFAAKKEIIFNSVVWFDQNAGFRIGTFGSTFNTDQYILDLNIPKNADRGTLYYTFLGSTYQAVPSGYGTINIFWRGTINKIHALAFGWNTYSGTIVMDAGTNGLNTLRFFGDTTTTDTTILIKDVIIESLP